MIKIITIFCLLFVLQLKHAPPNEIFIKYYGISDKPFRSLTIYDHNSKDYYDAHDKEEWEDQPENQSFEVSPEDFGGLKKLISKYNGQTLKNDDRYSGYEITIIQGPTKQRFYLHRIKCVELFKNMLTYLRQNNTNFSLKSDLEDMIVRIDW